MSTDARPKIRMNQFGSWLPCEVEGCYGERELLGVDRNDHKIIAPCDECRKRRALAAHNVPAKAD